MLEATVYLYSTQASVENPKLRQPLRPKQRALQPAKLVFARLVLYTNASFLSKPGRPQVAPPAGVDGCGPLLADGAPDGAPDGARLEAPPGPLGWDDGLPDTQDLSEKI